MSPFYESERRVLGLKKLFLIFHLKLLVRNEYQLDHRAVRDTGEAVQRNITPEKQTGNLFVTQESRDRTPSKFNLTDFSS